MFSKVDRKKRSNLTLLILSIIVAFFYSCTSANFPEVADFYSTVENNNNRSISEFLNKVENKSKKNYYYILNDQYNDVSPEFKDIAVKLQVIDSLMNSFKFSKAKELIEEISKSKEHPNFFIDDLNLTKLEIEANINSKNLILFKQSEAYFSRQNSELEIYNYCRFLLIKTLFLWSRSQYQEAISCAQYGRHLLTKNGLISKFPKTNLALISWIAHLFNENETQRKLSNQLFKYSIQEHTRLNYIHNKLKDSVYLINFISNDNTIVESLQSLYKNTINPKYKSEICLDLVTKLAELQSHNSIYNNHIEYCEQIDKLSYPRGRLTGYLIFSLAASVQGDNELSNYYMEKVKQIKSSSEVETKWNNYYVSSTMFQIHCNNISYNGDIEYLDSAMASIKKQFNLAETLFSDKSDFHLDDYYMLLTLDLVGVFSGSNTYSTDYLSLFYEFLEKAKLQNVKLQTAKRSYYDDNITSPRDSINFIIAKKLDQISQWENVMDASSSIYEDLYFLFSERSKFENESILLPKLKFENLQSTLKSQNALYIEYLSTEDLLGAFTIDSDGINFYMYDFQEVDSLSKVINNSYKRLTHNQLTEIKRALFQFHIESYSNVYVSPSGPTNNLPFSALINSNQTLNNVIGPESIEGFIRNQIQKEKSSVFCFNDNKTLRKKFNNKVNQGPIYTKLPFSFESISEISKMLNKNSATYFGENFTQKAVLENLGSDIVHLSTHGLTNKSIINDNAIVVWKDGSPEQMRTLSFDNQKEYPKFIYLDGCNTAIGVHQIGEGTFSLSRIFAKNGVETIIKTLWPIDDQSSAFFSKSYYENWITGISAGEAFHLAQQQTKAQYPQPYHWAPFVLEGNPNLYLSQN
ncbi:MAG: CHAT domain-containing protein [Saprospiraceae bacterium]|jgi:CHAT domain-containing protein